MTLYTDKLLRKKIRTIAKEMCDDLNQYLKKKDKQIVFWRYRSTFKNLAADYIINKYRDEFLSKGVQMKANHSYDDRTKTISVIFYSKETLRRFVIRMNINLTKNNHFKNVEFVEAVYLIDYEEIKQLKNEDENIANLQLGEVLFTLDQLHNDWQDEHLKELRALQDKYNCHLPFDELENLYEVYRHML